MSSWHYQIMRHVDDSGDEYLAIHERYIMHDKQESWTERPVPIEAETTADLRMALIDILRDMERYGVRDARTGEVVQTGKVGQM